MKAWRIHRFGGPDVLALDDVQQPQPEGAGDAVLVRIAATSVNPVDYKTREGKFPAVGEDALPCVLGRDVAGTVETDGGGFRAGERVFGMPGTDRGSFSQFILMKSAELARLPDAVDLTLAGGVPLAALTAWQGLFDHGDLKAGERVLILGAPGGVGHFAVQFAAHVGATVYATGRAQDRQFLQDLGADHAIDTDATPLDAAVGAPVDLVYDLLGPKAQADAWQVIQPAGRFVSTLQEPDAKAAGRERVRTARYMAEPSAEQLDRIAALLASGKVRVAEQRRFEFPRLRDALDMLENEHTQGKIIVTVD